MAKFSWFTTQVIKCIIFTLCEITIIFIPSYQVIWIPSNLIHSVIFHWPRHNTCNNDICSDYSIVIIAVVIWYFVLKNDYSELQHNTKYKISHTIIHARYPLHINNFNGCRCQRHLEILLKCLAFVGYAYAMICFMIWA